METKQVSEPVGYPSILIAQFEPPYGFQYLSSEIFIS